MSYCEYGIRNKQPISSKYQTTLREETSETSMPEVLELIHTTHDIGLLTRAFYLLGLYLLSEESGCDKIIKCKVLYDKILMVLNCGLQTKVCIALNLISALLLFGDEQGYSRRQTLHIYAQNMIKTSGCLAAMCDLFTNCIMQRVTLRALCSSLCASAGAAQSTCAHLVPQCIQRCHQDQLEIFSLLQILLYNNDRNIQLFHESNGMSLFTRETLQQPECLHLLSTITENKNPLNIMIMNKSNEIFEILRYLLSKYGSESLLGKWSLIILYSQHKDITTEVVTSDAIEAGQVNNISNNNDKRAKNNTLPFSRNKSEERQNTFPYNNDDTSQLFHNIYKEIMMLQQNNCVKNKKQDLNCYKDILEPRKNNALMNYKLSTKKQKLPQDHKIYEDKCTSPSGLINKTNDMSFSFLKKQETVNINTKTRKYTENKNNILKTSDSLMLPSDDLYEYTNTGIAQHLVNYTNTNLESNNTMLEFKPPYVSTPKHSNTILKTTYSSNSLSSTLKSFSKRQDRRNRKVQKVYKGKSSKINLNEKTNKAISTKIFDLINGSCTTLVKSFTNIKNIFKRKPSEGVPEEETNAITTIEINTSCSYSFTNYMNKRDAYLKGIENNTVLNKLRDRTNYCNTCNDTGVLRHKLKNDKSLQKTIKKLKLGINLYGCNFKKISRTMWPRENYMTPSVLYNLYRKLIIK